MDKRTGFQYAPVEFETYKEALAARKELLGQTVTVDWAFAKGPRKSAGRSSRLRRSWTGPTCSGRPTPSTVPEGADRAGLKLAKLDEILAGIRAAFRSQERLGKEPNWIKLNLLRDREEQDQRTGFQYALVEFETYKEAQPAREELDESDPLGQTVTVDWAFAKGPRKSAGRSKRPRDNKNENKFEE